jgi:phosphoenolpyruvate synthase/pyruvate phosphate dikinase
MKIFILILTTFLLTSCFSKDDAILIASFNEKELFLSDITKDMSNEIKDSAYFVEKFMNDWIRKELMISYAEMNLSKDLIEFEKQIEDYRASLLIYAYQKEILNQNFDTTIAFSEIEDYFEQYKDEFKLSKNIFRGRFIVIDKLAPNLDKVDKLYMSEKEIANNFLDDYCHQFSKECYLDCNTWQYFSVFNQKFPDLISDEEIFLKKTKGTFFEDDIFRYYVFIKDYKIRGSKSPLEFEREKIRDVLLNKKKINYLKKLENELYKKALAKKQIKIY